MTNNERKTKWDEFVEAQLAAGIDLQKEADRNFRNLIGSLLDHHQSVLSPIWLPRDVGDRFFDVHPKDDVATANYNAALIGALADLSGYSVGTSKRIELMLAVYSLYEDLERSLTDANRAKWVATRGMLDVEIEDTVSRLHNYREKLALCVDKRQKHRLKIDRNPLFQGVGFKDVFKAARSIKEDAYLKRVLGSMFNNSRVQQVMKLRHGVTHALSPAFGRGKLPPRWELDEQGEIQEIPSVSDISYPEVVRLINVVWKDFILGTEQLYEHKWI